MKILLSLALVFLSFIAISCEPEVKPKSTDTAGVHNEDGFNLSIKVNNGASITPESKVSIQISASNASEMYITQESSCNLGGAWESINSFKLRTLQKSNQVNFFYAKVRSSARESDCVFTSIEHDSLVPTIQLTSPSDGSTLVDPNALPLVGTCSEDVKISILMSGLTIGTVQCIGGVWGSTLDTTALANGSFAIQVKGVDRVSNASVIYSYTFTK